MTNPRDRPSFEVRSSRNLQTLALVSILVFAIFGVLYVGRSAFIPLALGLMGSFALRPPVDVLTKVGIPRAAAAPLVVGVFIAAGVWGLASLTTPARSWYKRMPTAVRTLERRVEPLRRPVSQLASTFERAGQIVDKPKRGTTLRVVDADEPSAVSSALKASAQLLASILAALITLFGLIWGEQFIARVVWFVPGFRDTGNAEGLVSDLQNGLTRYLFTVSAINLGLGVVVGATLSAVGMPNAPLWGAVACVANFVPYLGALFGVAVLALASLLAFPDGYMAVVPPLIYASLTVLEGNVVTPAVLGKTLRINPLVLFIWLVLWAWLWGVAGAMLAIPLLMVLKMTAERSPELHGLAALLRR